MIQTGFGYVSFLIVFCGLAFWITTKYSHLRVFQILSPVVIIYLGISICATAGAFGATDSVGAAQGMISGNLLPCALVLLLLNADIRKIVKMGPKLVLSMLGCSLTVVIGFILTYLLLKKVLPEDSWMTLGAISGAWIGGSENMVAAAQILGLPDNNMTYCLLMDTVVYGIWISILFAMVNKADWFNKWTKADTSMVENAIKQIEEEHNDTTIIPLWETLAVLAVAFGVGSLSQYVAKFLPVTTILNASGWSVLIATTIGIILAMTPLGKLRAVTLGQVCMYVIMGNIASWTDFLALKDAPFYLLAGLLVMVFHGICLILMCKIFKLDLFTANVASTANWGGVGSAPIMAGAFNPALVPIGALMGLLGNIEGTYVAVTLAHILHRL